MWMGRRKVAAAEAGHKARDGDHPAGSSSVESMEEKQQLSPVCVIDFPFHDEDDDGDERSDAGTCCSPSFLHCQPDLDRSRSAPHKIRRLDGLAQQAAVDPVDLEPRFVESGASVSDDTQQAHSDSSGASTEHDSAATTTTTSTTLSSSDEEQYRGAGGAGRQPELRHRLLARVLKDGDDDTAAAASDVTERLLLDFFAEGLHRGRSSMAGPVVGTVKPSPDDGHEAALVRAARDWVQGAGTRWGVEDVLYAGPAALADMDRERRWTCVGEEKLEVGAAVGEMVMAALVAELVSDLAARC